MSRPVTRGSIHYTPMGSGRRVLIEQIKLTAVLALTCLVLLGLETTALSKIHIPLFGWQAASPALGLLLTMAVGFIYSEREGAVMGLFAGWLANASMAGSTILLYPILYVICGYMSGTVGRRHLAHNLPSFSVFALVGGGLHCLWALSEACIRLRGIPPTVWILSALVPVWVLTVLFSVPVYGLVRLEQWLLKTKN